MKPYYRVLEVELQRRREILAGMIAQHAKSGCDCDTEYDPFADERPHKPACLLQRRINRYTRKVSNFGLDMAYKKAKYQRVKGLSC